MLLILCKFILAMMTVVNMLWVVIVREWGGDARVDGVRVG